MLNIQKQVRPGHGLVVVNSCRALPAFVYSRLLGFPAKLRQKKANAAFAISFFLRPRYRLELAVNIIRVISVGVGPRLRRGIFSSRANAQHSATVASFRTAPFLSVGAGRGGAHASGHQLPDVGDPFRLSAAQPRAKALRWVFALS